MDVSDKLPPAVSPTRSLINYHLYVLSPWRRERDTAAARLSSLYPNVSTQSTGGRGPTESERVDRPFLDVLKYISPQLQEPCRIFMRADRVGEFSKELALMDSTRKQKMDWTYSEAKESLIDGFLKDVWWQKKIALRLLSLLLVRQPGPPWKSEIVLFYTHYT